MERMLLLVGKSSLLAGKDWQSLEVAISTRRTREWSSERGWQVGVFEMMRWFCKTKRDFRNNEKPLKKEETIRF